jgi:transposase-like protein
MTAELNKPHFQDADKARQHLEAIRWPNGAICPHCGSVSKDHYALQGKAHRPGLHKCKDCREQFSVTVGTVFERSKVPLHLWMIAVHMICSSKKGCSSHQLQRTLGVQYKTAWFMSHRIREAMKSPGGLMGSGGGIVEADETYWGNKKPYGQNPHGTGHKMKVVSLVERNGNARSFHVTNVTAGTLKPILQANIAKEATLMTDEWRAYKKVGKEFAAHETVNHGIGEYARGDVTTNTVEGFFSILKRGLIGTFHHVGEQHLQRYVTEFDFRYNHREKKVKVNGKWEKTGFNDAERATALLKAISGKRLTYRRTNAAA